MSILLLAGSVNCLLFLIGRNLRPEIDMEQWLNNDNFAGHPEKEPGKKYLIYELNRLKDKFRIDLNDTGSIQNENGENLNPLEIYTLVEAHKNRINKVRLIIQNEFSVMNHSNKQTGVKYVVARAYWLDNNGKKFRKFSKNMGPEDKVKTDGKIQARVLETIAKDLEEMMWKEYLMEYPKG